MGQEAILTEVWQRLRYMMDHVTLRSRGSESEGEEISVGKMASAARGSSAKRRANGSGRPRVRASRVAAQQGMQAVAQPLSKRRRKQPVDSVRTRGAADNRKASPQNIRTYGRRGRTAESFALLPAAAESSSSSSGVSTSRSSMEMPGSPSRSHSWSDAAAQHGSSADRHGAGRDPRAIPRPSSSRSSRVGRVSDTDFASPRHGDDKQVWKLSVRQRPLDVERELDIRLGVDVPDSDDFQSGATGSAQLPDVPLINPRQTNRSVTEFRPLSKLLANVETPGVRIVERMAAAGSAASRGAAARERVFSDMYIRHFESPEEHAVMRETEYDMDESDAEWLQGQNARKGLRKRVSDKEFERCITTLERLSHEWFMKQVEASRTAHGTILDQATAVCTVCQDGTWTDENRIIFCDGCGVAVHQACYGVAKIPEDDWYCDRCLAEVDGEQRCVCCGESPGAMKPTDDGHWAHLVCALWIPELYVADASHMGPVCGIRDARRRRPKAACDVCKRRSGMVLRCSSRGCAVHFHVTCARKRGALFLVDADGRRRSLRFACFCEEHSRDRRAAGALGVGTNPDRAAEAGSVPHSQTTRVSGHGSELLYVGDPRVLGEAIRPRASTEGAYSPVPSASSSPRSAGDDAPGDAEDAEDHGARVSRPEKRDGIPEHWLPEFERMMVKHRLSMDDVSVDQDTALERAAGVDPAVLCKVHGYWLEKRKRLGHPLCRSLLSETYGAHSVKRKLRGTIEQKYLRMLDMRQNLERVRLLVDLMQRRERIKRTLVETRFAEVNKRLPPSSSLSPERPGKRSAGAKERDADRRVTRAGTSDDSRRILRSR